MDAVLVTLRDVEKATGIPRRQLNYAADSYKIESTGRAGPVRLYDRAAVDRLVSAARRIAAGRGEAYA